MDACSPKDGAPGLVPLRTIDDIILRLTTSGRACSSITRLLEEEKKPCLELFFLPFDNKMSTFLEYRVFCAPLDGKITAVSQYKWHKLSIFHDRPAEELQSIAESILGEVRRAHGDILEVAKAGERGEAD